MATLCRGVKLALRDVVRRCVAAGIATALADAAVLSGSIGIGEAGDRDWRFHRKRLRYGSIDRSLDGNPCRRCGWLASTKPAADTLPVRLRIAAGGSSVAKSSAKIANPRLWGPPPNQAPNRYVAVTTVR